MTSEKMRHPALTYNGAVIRDRAERLNLTDMWKAAGQPQEKRPNDWAAKSGREFIEFVALAENTAIGGIFHAARGRTGGTWAHWQIGLAYAKYLSPEFHMWCNTVVRAHMQGAPESPRIDLGAIGGVFKAVLNRALSETVPAMIEQQLAADPRIAVRHALSTREILDEEKVPSKGRRGLIVSAGSDLRAWCHEKGVTIMRCPRTRTWLYPAGAAHEWLTKRGRGLIAAWRDRQIGQSNLFVFKGGKA